MITVNRRVKFPVYSTEQSYVENIKYKYVNMNVFYQINVLTIQAFVLSET